MDRARIAGVPCDRMTMDAAVERIAGYLAEGGRCRALVTNANKAWLARGDDRLRGLLETAEMAVPEWAMAWAARRLGIQGVHHVGGITLMVRLLDEAEREGWGVYFLGARPEIVSALVARQAVDRPGLRVVGAHHGYLDAESRTRVLEELERTRPELLFVAMGSPLQEYFIEEAWRRPGARVALGVGGSFDVLAGLRKDAPAWARGRGLEWLYRMAQDPIRLGRRYLVTNGWFVWKVWRERGRRGR